MSRAFDGLEPARGIAHTAWVLEAMAGRSGVALIVPGGFDAYVRILHPLFDGSTWSDTAARYLQPGVDGSYPLPFPSAVVNVEGNMGESAVDALVPLLREATSTPGACHFGLWEGWGELQRGSDDTLWYAGAASGRLARMRLALAVCRQERRTRRLEHPVHDFVEACAVAPWWGGRDTLLFDGPVDAVRSIGGVRSSDGSVDRRSPQWWWPEDRAWFVGNEIDLPWSYVAGPRELVDAVLGSVAFEAIEVAHDDLW